MSTIHDLARQLSEAFETREREDDEDDEDDHPSTPTDDVRFAATTIRAAVLHLRRQVAAAPEAFATWPLEQEGFRARREAEAAADRLDRLAARMEAAG